MKFLIIGDLHFKITNVPEVEVYIEKATQLAISENPDYIVILGDVLHTHERVHTTPMNLACDFFDRLRKIAFTYILVGNHDMISPNQFLTDQHWMNAIKNWKNVKIVDTVEILSESGMLFFFISFVPNGRFIEALNTNKEYSWTNATCIFAHQEFYGCKMGAIISETGDRWDIKNPLVITGHIHSKQKPQANIYYTGSAFQHSFGDSGDNIILIAEFNSKNPEPIFREIDLGLVKKKIVYKDIDDITESFKLENSSNIQYKLSLSGDHENFKAFKKTPKYTELVNKGVKVVFKPKSSVESKHSESVQVSQFSDLLLQSVLEEKNEHLYCVYENVINKKNIRPSDVLII